MVDEQLDNEFRSAWTTTGICQIYSNSRKKWFDGEIASIFHDDEGEWLEVRYDKSMSKQVQRYSSDIRPKPSELKKASKSTASKTQKKTAASGFPFPEPEMKNKTGEDSNADSLAQSQQNRTSWSKGDEVEIFSNTHQEWYLGEIVDIIKDQEGEWLNVVWARANGEAMSKQVQRFSTDVRPPQKSDDDSDSDEEDPNTNRAKNSGHLSSATQREVDRIMKLALQIQKRKDNFRRRCPPFSRTLKPSNFQYPATAIVKRQRKLIDVEEKADEHSKNQLLFDKENSNGENKAKPAEKKKVKGPKIETWKSKRVQQFIRGLGKEYVKYVSKFRVMNGRRFQALTEADLKRLNIAKLHSMKILLSIAKKKSEHGENEFLMQSESIEVLNWSTADVGKWMSSQIPAVSVYQKKFVAHGIDGLMLFDLDDADLTLMGVKKSHRTKMKKVIATLKAQCFDDESEQKEEESNNSNKRNNNNSRNENENKKSNNSEVRPKHKRRKSVQIADLNGLINSVHLSEEARDDLLLTVCHLMVEVGQVFNIGKIPIITASLRQKVNLYTAGGQNGVSSNASNNNNNNNSDENVLAGLDIKQLSVDMSGEKKRRLIEKLSTDNDSLSPIGLGFASSWMKTLSNDHEGHKRRSSLHLNANQLTNLIEDEDDEEQLSDLEID